MCLEKGRTVSRSGDGDAEHRASRLCLEFTPVPEGITLLVENGDVPAGEDNLVYRAAKSISTYAGVRSGVEIRLKKPIPVAAGLGGGSADAAATPWQV